LSGNYLQFVNSSLIIIKTQSEINQSKHITLLFTELIITELDKIFNCFENSPAREDIVEILETINKILFLYENFLVLLSYYPFSDFCGWQSNN
jgi:hypothetical protein